MWNRPSVAILWLLAATLSGVSAFAQSLPDSPASALTESGSTAPGAESLKSTELVKTDRMEQYKAVKATMEEFGARGLVHSRIDPHWDEYPQWKEYSLADCSSAGDYVPWLGDKATRGKDRDEDLDRLISVANDVVRWTSDFEKMEIPGDVWQPIVSDFEQAAANDRDSYPIRATQDRLVEALNRYRVEKKPSLPKFDVRPMCGDGEIEVHIALTPPDGQLFLIPVFSYKLCQAQHLNPSDTKACDRWTEVLNGSASWVSGDYIYMARWTDGSVRCGPLGFTSVKKNGETFSIAKMRSPECKTDW